MTATSLRLPRLLRRRSTPLPVPFAAAANRGLHWMLPPAARASLPAAGLALLLALATLATLGLGALPAAAQGSRIGGAPAGPPPEGTMPGPNAQQLADETEETAIALRDSAIKGTKAFGILSSLTTEVGPRPAGSAGDRAA